MRKVEVPLRLQANLKKKKLMTKLMTTFKTIPLKGEHLSSNFILHTCIVCYNNLKILSNCQNSSYQMAIHATKIPFSDLSGELSIETVHLEFSFRSTTLTATMLNLGSKGNLAQLILFEVT